MPENADKIPVEKTIGFRGTVDYRRYLKQAALDRRLSVQKMLENAVDAYLNPQNLPKQDRTGTTPAFGGELKAVQFPWETLGALASQAAMLAKGLDELVNNKEHGGNRADTNQPLREIIEQIEGVRSTPVSGVKLIREDRKRDSRRAGRKNA
jgi:hypothetical protein